MFQRQCRYNKLTMLQILTTTMLHGLQWIVHYITPLLLNLFLKYRHILWKTLGLQKHHCHVTIAVVINTTKYTKTVCRCVTPATVWYVKSPQNLWMKPSLVQNKSLWTPAILSNPAYIQYYLVPAYIWDPASIKTWHWCLSQLNFTPRMSAIFSNNWSCCALF